MPAERTKAVKRSTSGNQLVWNQYSESSHASEVAFTPNVTPISFNDSLPPLVDIPPTEFVLFPPPEEISAPRRQPHSKKKPENHIPRPPNAFILFRSSFIKSQHVSTEVETNHSTLSKIIGLTWQQLPDDQRQFWHGKAKEALEEHKRKFPKYAFRPVQTKAKGAPSEKRKVREVEPKDIKRCTKIAQLLVQGKKGHELDAAIQEFDKHHVPEIITRFEAPITAKAYRRSSSAPIPDTDNARSTQTFFAQEPSSLPRKPRSASTRPTRCSTPTDAPSQQDLLPTVDSQLKQEGSFDFGSFSFDNISSPLPTFDCDPMSIQQPDFIPDFHPGLTIDTSFMSDWTSSPSPVSPLTPDSYGMSPSPPPSFDAAFDSFDQGMDSPFDDFSAASFTFDQPCTTQPSMQMCGNGVISATDSLYATFEQQHVMPPLAHLDMDFSAFMNAIPQYAL